MLSGDSLHEKKMKNQKWKYPSHLGGGDFFSSRDNKEGRTFVEKNYKELKTLNPKLPILIRECSGAEPQLWARFDFGVEKGIKLEGLSEAQISKALEDLFKLQFKVKLKLKRGNGRKQPWRFKLQFKVKLKLKRGNGRKQPWRFKLQFKVKLKLKRGNGRKQPWRGHII
ncbi:hypothetical protein Ahy_A09g045717 [Arachis hypogaea]|uniref:Ribosomal protein/NADH dehydrogenase domain-containing protein n=1 Tax=Arachis hypogaea TaxID=3818 RepID=A0A445BN09_ARAHY|nr:hypothetical protein Ahy_A09g045717 [Arachis hypogaea]